MILLLILIVVGLAAFIAVNYNKAQFNGQLVMEAHSNIMASMKKRADLVNKLMDITKGYGDHEKLTHIAVVQAENANLDATHSRIDQAVTSITAMARNYPELKADGAYQQLMNQLHVLEDGLQKKREAYNANVRQYNHIITTIPFVFFASSVGFRPAKFFDVSNSDSLENLKDFNANDGEALKGLLKQVGTSTKTLAMDATRAGKDFVNNKLHKTPDASPSEGE